MVLACRATCGWMCGVVCYSENVCKGMLEEVRRTLAQPDPTRVTDVCQYDFAIYCRVVIFCTANQVKDRLSESLVVLEHSVSKVIGYSSIG